MIRRTSTSIYILLCFVLLCALGYLSQVYGEERDAPRTDVIITTAPTIEGYSPVENMSSENGASVTVQENPEIANLRTQIADREKRIQETEREIKGINQNLNQIYKKKDTLENELNALTLIGKKNEAQIRQAEEGIRQGELSLEALDTSLVHNAENLEVLHSVLKRNFRQANEFELRGMTFLLMHASFSDVLLRVEELERYSKALHFHLELLESETKQLEKNRVDITAERTLLEKKRRDLEDFHKLHQFSVQQQEVLVRQTRNDEAEYQKLLKEKQEERLELQQDMYAYESQIEYLRDPSAVPGPKKGLLYMPFSSSPRLTQRFGETSFARANALRYGRPFHDGLDFGLPHGTQLFSSADGVVVGTGNTDLAPRCESWGKWIAVEHPFGLTTLYAHLSLVKVRVGQTVKRGDLIGYSGNTGFSTGPHLHFGVYDSTGIRVVPYERISANPRCRGTVVPVAAQDAKLNPAEYLPL